VSAQGEQGWTVLLVDDDNSLRKALARTIRVAGFEVHGYASVEALLEAGVPQHDACLVLDVDLPGQGGLAFKRMLRDVGRDLPTIFITALEPERVSESLAALDPVAVLYKPFSNDDLLGAIDRCRPVSRDG
jgi:FixJ family two-component response regulator